MYIFLLLMLLLVYLHCTLTFARFNERVYWLYGRFWKGYLSVTEKKTKQKKGTKRKEKKRKEKKREEKERKEKKRREKYIYHISTAFLRHKPPADTSLINTKTIILDLEG